MNTLLLRYKKVNKAFLICLIFGSGFISCEGQTQTKNCFCTSEQKENRSLQTDTIKLVAVYTEAGEFDGDPNFNELAALGRLDKERYRFAIGFKPINCDKVFFVPCGERRANQMKLFDHRNVNRKMEVTCIFYSGFKSTEYHNCNYFVVSAVKFTD